MKAIRESIIFTRKILLRLLVFGIIMFILFIYFYEAGLEFTTPEFLNALKIIWCWSIWSVANILWLYISFKKKDWAQVFLWITFILANIYGWIMWSL